MSPEISELLIQISAILTPDLVEELIETNPEAVGLLQQCLDELDGTPEAIPSAIINKLADEPDKAKRFLQAIKILGLFDPNQLPELAERMEHVGLLKSESDEHPYITTAKKHFGLTHDISEAGYINPDGTMLDFSGRHYSADHPSLKGHRNVDHRELPDEIQAPKDTKVQGPGTANMIHFMGQTGAIRHMPGVGLDVTKKPTDAQIKTLAQHLGRSDIQIDISHPETGRNIHSHQMERVSYPKLKQHFDTHFATELGKSTDWEQYRAYGDKYLGLFYPVSFDGVENIYRDVPYHITIKCFENSQDPSEIINRIGSMADIPDPAAISLRPDIINSDNGNSYYVLFIDGLPLSVIRLYEKLDGIGVQYPTFKPHVTVTKDLWEKIHYGNLNGGLTPPQAKMKIRPLELRRHNEVIHAWDNNLQKDMPGIYKPPKIVVIGGIPSKAKSQHTKQGWRQIANVELANGLEHHVYQDDTEGSLGQEYRHALRTKSGANLATMQIMQTMHGAQTPEIMYSGVNPAHRGKGFGKQLYNAALMHHGKLNSGSSISDNAHKLWTGWDQTPGIKTEIAPRGESRTDQPHKAENIGIQNNLKTFPKIKSKLKKALETIKKALHPKDLSTLLEAHNPDAKYSVNPERHIKQGGVSERYRNMLEKPGIHPASISVGHPQIGETLDPTTGFSNKTIHEIPEGPETHRYMTKPYQKTIEPGTERYGAMPIGGWATMASKNLYRAAGIGDLSESVSTHEHRSIPLVVSHMAPHHVNMYEIAHPDTIKDQTTKGLVSSMGQPKFDSLQIKQIGVMDFLTGNIDRHTRNLMVNPMPNKQGQHDLLAIDHDRSFQYAQNPTHRNGLAKPGQELIDNPGNYIKHSALKGPMKSLKNPIEARERLRNWWDKNKEHIGKTFRNELNAIQDPSHKRHIEQNFKDRFDLIDKWAQDPKLHQTHSLFSPDLPLSVKHTEIVPRFGTGSQSNLEPDTIPTGGTVTVKGSGEPGKPE